VAQYQDIQIYNIYPMLQPAATILTHLKHVFITCCVWNVCLNTLSLPPYPSPQPSSLSNSHKGMSNSYSNYGRLIWPSQSSLISKVSWWLNDYCQLHIYNLILFFHFWLFWEEWLSFGSSDVLMQSMLSVFVCSYRLLLTWNVSAFITLTGWDRNLF